MANLKYCYNSITKKIWSIIEKKYESESTKALKTTLLEKEISNHKNKIDRSKTLILLSVAIALVATISEYQLLLYIFKTYGKSLFFDNVETVVKTLMANLIPIIGFIGSIYLLRRKIAGLWLIGIWCSLLIFPIYFSYNENGAALSKNYFNYYNIFPYLQAYYFESSAELALNAVNHIYQVNFKVKYSPFATGIAINVVPIIYLLFTFIVFWQNRALFSTRRKVYYFLTISVSIILPIVIYMGVKEHHSLKEHRYYSLKAQLEKPYGYTPKPQASFHNTCFEFTRPWFEANKDKYIQQVTCYRGKETISFHK